MDDAFQHPGFWLNEDHFELCGVFTVVGVIGVAGVFGRLVVEKYFGVFPKFLVGVFDEPSCRSSDFALGMNQRDEWLVSILTGLVLTKLENMLLLVSIAHITCLWSKCPASDGRNWSNPIHKST